MLPSKCVLGGATRRSGAPLAAPSAHDARAQEQCALDALLFYDGDVIPGGARSLGPRTTVSPHAADGHEARRGGSADRPAPAIAATITAAA